MGPSSLAFHMIISMSQNYLNTLFFIALTDLNQFLIVALQPWWAYQLYLQKDFSQKLYHKNEITTKCIWFIL